MMPRPSSKLSLSGPPPAQTETKEKKKADVTDDDNALFIGDNNFSLQRTGMLLDNSMNK
jgi:hypothetical protein